MLAVASAPPRAPANKAPASRQTGASLSALAWRNRSLRALVMVLPSLVGIGTFTALPVLAVFVLSLFKWDLLTSPKFAGLENYRSLVADPVLVHSLFVTVLYVAMALPIEVGAALLLAMVLRHDRPGFVLLRTCLVMPYLATPVALGVIWSWIFNPLFGILDAALGAIGLPRVAWLNSTTWALPVVAVVTAWQYAGYYMLFFYSGLGAIPKVLNEAASLDGAGPVRQFWSLTLPLLRPTLLFVTVISVIQSFQVFDAAYVMTGGGPGDATNVFNFEIYTTGFTQLDLGYASAMAAVLFAIIAVLSLLLARLLTRRITYQFDELV